MHRFSEKTLIVALALVAGLLTVEGQLRSQQMSIQAMQQQASSTMERIKSMLQLDPLVEVGDSELGGRKVNVHLPGIYDLKLDTRAEHSGVRIKQSVLSGLVNIFIDRTRDPTTRLNSGPISVRVAGLPMYQNTEARSLFSSSSS